MNYAAARRQTAIGNGSYGLHHAIIHGDIAYCSWRDACLAVVDVADRGPDRSSSSTRTGARPRRRHAQCPAAA